MIMFIHFRFKIWSMKGQKKLLELLADMGYVLYERGRGEGEVADMGYVLCGGARGKGVLSLELLVVCVNHCTIYVCLYVCVYLCVCLHSRLPLVQCKQKFGSMDVQYRENLKQLIDESSPKFQLDDMTYGSFVAQFGYKIKVYILYSTHNTYIVAVSIQRIRHRVHCMASTIILTLY